MKRIMVNVDDPEVSRVLLEQAAKAKRSLSSEILFMIERDLRAQGLLASNDVTREELLSLAQELGMDAALETLRRRLRSTKSAAA